MAQAALPLMAITTVLGAAGKYTEGKEQQAAYNYNAKIDEYNAGLARAEASAKSQETARQGRLMESSILARAAAAGSASGETFEMILAKNAGDYRYRQMVDLYEGESEAYAHEASAMENRRKGKAAKRAGRLAAVTTLLSGGKSMADTYSAPEPAKFRGTYQYGHT